MLRPTSDGVRYARLYASFAAQFGHAPSHFAERSNPDASSHTDGAAVLLVPKPVPLIVTVALCDHCPELLRMDGCAATAVDHRITAQANARRPLVEGFRIASARAKPFPPQATSFRPDRPRSRRRGGQKSARPATTERCEGSLVDAEAPRPASTYPPGSRSLSARGRRSALRR